MTLVQWLPPLLGEYVGDNQSTTALLLNTVVATIVLLPATTCMGISTVALVEAWRRKRSAVENRYTVAWLYGFNTFGASAGIAFTAYIALPRLGTTQSALVLSCLCLGAVAMVWWWQRVCGPSPADQRPAARQSNDDTLVATGLSNRQKAVLYSNLFFTGLTAIGIEFVGTYVLAQILEDTVYTFANILAVFLLGTALGAWLYTRPILKSLSIDPDRWTPWLCYGLALSVIVMGNLLADVEALFRAFAPIGSSHVRLLAGELALAIVVFLPPTVLMGALFSHLVGRFSQTGVGKAYACSAPGSLDTSLSHAAGPD